MSKTNCRNGHCTITHADAGEKVKTEGHANLAGSRVKIMTRKIKVGTGWKQTALSVLATVAVTTIFKLLQDQLMDHIDRKLDKVD